MSAQKVFAKLLFFFALFCSLHSQGLFADTQLTPRETIQPVRSQFNFGIYTGYPYYYYNYYPYDFYYPYTRCNETDVSIYKVRHEVRGKRPFSWYYPYSFEYYYPSSSNYRCDWIYTQRGYKYYCK